jgi:hypothetical protein
VIGNGERIEQIALSMVTRCRYLLSNLDQINSPSISPIAGRFLTNTACTPYHTKSLLIDSWLFGGLIVATTAIVNLVIGLTFLLVAKVLHNVG